MFSDPAVVRYWSAEPWTSVAFAEQSIARALDSYRDRSEVRFGIALAATRIPCRHRHLHRVFRPSRRCELGYALARAHWGNAAMPPKRCERLLHYGFHDART